MIDASVKLYHPRGPVVTLPLPYFDCGDVSVPKVDYAYILQRVSDALDAGWLANAPGLEAGEEKDTVAFVVHGQSEGQRGDVTSFILLYSANDAYKFSFLKVYLNKPQDIDAFEYASGMRLDTIPVYVGQDKPERGKNRQVDKFILPVPKPFGVVFKANPKWSEEAANAAKSKGEIYSVPRRVFVRWTDQKPMTTDTDAPSEADQRQRHNQHTDETQRWLEFFKSDPPLSEFNEFCQANFDQLPEMSQRSMQKKIYEHAKLAGWVWSNAESCYVRGRP